MGCSYLINASVDKQTEISVIYKCEKKFYWRNVWGIFVLIARTVREKVGQDKGTKNSYSFEIKERNLRNSFNVSVIDDSCGSCKCSKSVAKCSENKSKSQDEAWQWVNSQILEHEQKIHEKRMQVFDSAKQKVDQLNNTEIQSQGGWSDAAIHSMLRLFYGLHFTRFIGGERGSWNPSYEKDRCNPPSNEYYFVTTSGAQSPSGGGDDGLCSSATSLNAVGYKNLDKYI